MSLDLIITKQMDEFFKDQIDIAIKNQNVKISELAKLYLVNLLSKNTKENIVNGDLNQTYGDTPLSIIFHKSLMEPIEQKKIMLKYVGDYSLYVGGFFSESFNRKIIDLPYYINIGGLAFSNLSKVAGSSELRSIYKDVCARFSTLIDILIEVSFDTNITKVEDLIKSYDRWAQTGSAVLKRKLMEKGIMTVDKKIKVT
ncbi:MAG: hypothetical protein WCQ47_06280 [bacterium]